MVVQRKTTQLRKMVSVLWRRFSSSTILASIISIRFVRTRDSTGIEFHWNLVIANLALLVAYSRRYRRNATCLRLPLWFDRVVSSCTVARFHLKSEPFVEFSRNNPVVIGQDNTNVPNLVKLFGDAFARSSIEASCPVGQRMIHILRHISVCHRSISFVRTKQR